MSDLDALLAGIVAHPHEHVRWLIVADWLDDHGFADRAELLRLHRMLIDTCCEPDSHPNRAAWLARIVELIDQGVKPCVPQHTLMLPGGVPLVGHFIPPGSFLMGGSGSHTQRPIHRVTLTRGFFAGVVPVTQAQWRAVMGTDPSHFGGDELPVECVNWEDAASFCRKVMDETEVRIWLPTEAQWEYACRAGTRTRYYWGDLPKAGWVPDSETAPTTLGGTPPNPWGLCDLHGILWEWCDDWYERDYYGRSPETDPRCDTLTAAFRVLRGGSWVNDAEFRGSAYRACVEPERTGEYFGFRVAFTLS